MADRIKPVHVEEVEDVVIRFAGDSGDGMQLTGTQFTNTAAIIGNDISTLPEYPAEIRAPVGTLAGVSGFQVHIASTDIFTSGDDPHVLIAMNPAALKASLGDLMPGGTIIVDVDEFTSGNLKKASYASNPLDDGSLTGYHVHKVRLTTLNRHSVEGIEGLSTKEINRSRNFFALGLTFWIYDRPLDGTMAWIDDKFKKSPATQEANRRALMAGYHFGDTTEVLFHPLQDQARSPAGRRLPQGDRQRSYRPGHGDGRATGRQAPDLLHLPDHAGQRHPALPGAAQELRRAHLPG